MKHLLQSAGLALALASGVGAQCQEVRFDRGWMDTPAQTKRVEVDGRDIEVRLKEVMQVPTSTKPYARLEMHMDINDDEIYESHGAAAAPDGNVMNLFGYPTRLSITDDAVTLCIGTIDKTPIDRQRLDQLLHDTWMDQIFGHIVHFAPNTYETHLPDGSVLGSTRTAKPKNCKTTHECVTQSQYVLLFRKGGDQIKIEYGPNARMVYSTRGFDEENLISRDKTLNISVPRTHRNRPLNLYETLKLHYKEQSKGQP